MRMEKIAKAKPFQVILREKDLSEEEYQALAKEVISLCEKYGTTCVLHSFPKAAHRLNCRKLHMPLPGLLEMTKEERSWFQVLGASCHSLEDALKARDAGCTYITLGHIFATDCKKGLQPRGTGLVKTVAEKINIPVYAIGGICAENSMEVKQAGAGGICIMSSAMTCPSPEKLFTELIKN